MGWKVGCGQCGALVYTTGSRLPQHDTPEGERCSNRHEADTREEYVVGFDGDFWVYQGGAWEMGKNA
jgi:hypothetical protein